MYFYSFEYIFLFLPITFFVYFYLNKKRLVTAAKGFLLFASLFFYSWWNILYLPLILGSMLFNYTVGMTLAQRRYKGTINPRTILTIGIVVNIALLGYFKYSDFFIETVNWSLSTNVSLIHLTLPLAISFFTFQQIAYLVDSFRGETKEYDFLNYAIFVSFFPQLIAGPIVHHKEMMPQFAKMHNKVPRYGNIAAGIFIFSMGVFKKVVIADTFAAWATKGFDQAEVLTFFEAWATSLSYTFQLYFDFSGYTDMAIGAALLFNIKLPVNFNSPYKARDIQDFWRRWHITLSRFLRDYVYIPLGGNRLGSWRTYGNLMITFLIGGLWHGAGWTFVFWGFLHGAALVLHQVWRSFGIPIHGLLAWFLTFNFINISWVFFRAKEWEDAIKVLNGMFTGEVMLPQHFRTVLHDYEGVTFGKFAELFANIGGNVYTVLSLILAFLLIHAPLNSNRFMSDFKASRKLLFAALILFNFFVIYKLYFGVTSEFIYFNF